MDIVCMKNSDLITRFGMCVTPNINDYFAINIDLDDVTSDASKVALLKKFGLGSLHFLHPVQQYNEMNDKILATVRICFMEDKEIEALARKVKEVTSKKAASQQEQKQEQKALSTSMVTPIEDEVTVKTTLDEIMNGLIEPAELNQESVDMDEGDAVLCKDSIELLLTFKKMQMDMLQTAINKL